MRIVHTEEVRLFREVTGVEQALSQKTLAQSRNHIWWISATGPQLHQQHRGGRTHAFTRKLRSVDAVQTPGTGGHRQEENLQPTQPDRNHALRSRGTPLFL